MTPDTNKVHNTLLKHYKNCHTQWRQAKDLLSATHETVKHHKEGLHQAKKVLSDLVTEESSWLFRLVTLRKVLEEADIDLTEIPLKKAQD